MISTNDRQTGYLIYLETLVIRAIVMIIIPRPSVKRLRKMNGRIYLMPDNPDFSPIEVSGDMQVEICGVVTYILHNLLINS